MEWTADQKKVIDHRHNHMLVSAAAGSGKTAVLIERILSRLTDPENPVDIDHMLIVTFTNAAAKEMRTRLYNKIQDRCIAEPENERLASQLTLLSKAMVCTIDSFCIHLLRNYFNEVDLDPGFRVGDENEMALLKQDVLSDLFEEEYENGDESFLNFTETFSYGKSDTNIEDAVLTLSAMSESMPDPEGWLLGIESFYDIHTTKDLLSSAWFEWYIKEQQMIIQSSAEGYQGFLSFLEESGVPQSLFQFFQKEMQEVTGLSQFSTYEEALKLAEDFSFTPYPRKKEYAVDPELKDIIQKKRKVLSDPVKDALKIIKGDYSEQARLILGTKPVISELVRLTLKFREAFSKAKREDNLVDFGDLEHLALRILRRDGKKTLVAEELTAYFQEVMVDEYQDSNYLQEEILSSVCHEEDGLRNMTMVGDMKQSIYAFRAARPELFVNKYRAYRKDETKGVKLELHKNFRSTAAVIDTVNAFFECIMREEVGDILYDDDAKLYVSDPENSIQSKLGEQSEIHLLFNPKKDDSLAETDSEDESEEIAEDQYHIEARMIGREIKKLIGSGFMIYDGTLKENRPVTYKDMVILLRATVSRDSAYLEELEEMQIPVSVESRSGYFSSYEVQLMMNLLQVIDNPISDISLAAVLLSPVFGFSEEELAKIRVEYDIKESGNGFFGAIRHYLRLNGGEETLKEKLTSFLSKLELYREKEREETLSGLLRFIYEDTGLISLVGAMPNGERRKANLNYLILKAENFEATRYHGVFHFIRYIKRLKETSQDEGEVNAHSENENAVRIMTIHKSKGLEFPVVFYAGTGDSLKKGSRSRMDLHPDLGIGIDYVNFNERSKYKTLLRKVVQERELLESLGEELRVMYVAMTRAKEKLYITGVLKNLPEILDDLSADFSKDPEMLSFSQIVKSESVMMLLLKAYRNSFAKLQVHTLSELSAGKEALQLTHALNYYELQDLLETENTESLSVKEKLNEQVYYPYLPNDLHTVKQSVPVSYLKVKAYEEKKQEDGAVNVDFTGQESLITEPVENREEKDLSEEMQKERERIEARPPFMKTEEETSFMTGAERGTLYHLLLEKVDSEKPLSEELLRIQNEGLISKEKLDKMNPNKLTGFYESALGKRMRDAEKRNRVFKEKQFILGMDAKRVFEEKNLDGVDELVMVQGVIDLFFIEDDGIVLVDYKTDRLSAEELVDHYKKQIEIYKEALETMLHLPVKECYLYSLHLNKQVEVK